ncbi:hypothetical protein ACMXYQ_12430 [Neptuniibacter sp. PT34_22]|uniref:hypothetical protein n=1 Tax=Neptuniibacter sp. PT34_22 TaxID=3398205 RepID=UPI0039F62CA4
MLKRTFILLLILLSGCVAQEKKGDATRPDIQEPTIEYRISLEAVERFLRHGDAVFKVEKRDMIVAGAKPKWAPAAGVDVRILHVGKELRSEGGALVTDQHGQVAVKVMLADSLKYFRWVNKLSYGIEPELLEGIEDVQLQSPVKGGQEWKGWDASQVDMDYMVKLGVGNVVYWLPISYKDTRPLIEQVTKKIHSSLMLDVTLELYKEGNVLQGGDVFLIGRAPQPESLLGEYFTREDVKNYAVKTMPKYAQGESGGYDVLNYIVYPGDYKVRFKRGETSYESDIISIKNSELKRVFVH